MSSDVHPPGALPRSAPIRQAAFLLVAAGLLALALVPDQVIVRTKVVWGRGLLLAGGFLLLAAQAQAGRVVLRWPTFLAAALLPGLLALLHPLHTPIASAALARDEIERLLLVPVVCWLVSGVLDGSRDRRRLVACLALGGLIVGGWAVLERLSGWLPPGLGVEPANRADAGFGNPVFLGAWLVLTTPLLLAEALTGPPPWRWLAACAAGLCLPALLATKSAGTWLGFGTALVAGLFMLGTSLRLRVALATLLVAGAAALAISGEGVLLRPRAHGLIWQDSWNLFLDRPGGVGPGQFQLAFLPYASGELLALHPRSSTIINDVHCEPLQVLVELGWPGLVALIAILLGLTFSVRAAVQRPPPEASDRARFVGALAGVIGSIAQSAVSPDLRFHVTVMVLGVMLGLLASHGPEIVLTVRGRRLGRLALLLAALAGLAATGLDTYRRLAVADLLPRGTPFEITPEAERRVEHLREETARRPTDAAAQFDLGVALAEMQRYRDAAGVFQAALALSPDNPSVVRALGIVECLSGAWLSATTHLRAAAEADPEDAEVRYLLAFASYGRGDIHAAITEVEALLAVRPDHRQARLLLEKLRE